MYSFTAAPDYKSGFRLDETVAGGDQRYLHVLSIDGAVTSATATGDSTVAIALATGQSATITFEHDTVGATLAYAGANIALTPGVDTMPK